MKYFKHNNTEYVAYMREISEKEHVIDVFYICDMKPIINVQAQRFAENLFEKEPENETDFI